MQESEPQGGRSDLNPIEICVLRPGDETQLETFLAAHAAPSTCLGSNLRAAGLG
jgi:hypothetical protein